MKERKGFEKGTLAAQLLIEKYFYKQRPPGEGFQPFFLLRTRRTAG